MASQTPNAPAGRTAKKEGAQPPKRGIKNPLLYAGTVAILILTIVAFVFVPAAGGSASSGGQLSFGSFAGKPISYVPGNYLASQVQAINDSLRQQGLSEENFQLYAYQVWRSAFERTVVREGVLDAVKSAGAFVTENRLDERMSALPQFQEDGQFSSRLYRQSSSAERLRLRDQLRVEALSENYFSDVYGIGPSSQEMEFLKAVAKETRSIEYAAFPLSAYPESEVAAWAAKNAGLFRRLRLSRITAETKEGAEAIRQEIEGGLAFADAAKKSSKDSWASQGGDLGLRFFHELSAELEKAEDAEAIANLAPGGLSGVVKTLTGSFVFYRLEEAVKAAEPSDPALAASARTYMQAHERGLLEDWSITRAKAFAAVAAADFAGEAKKAGLEAKAAGPFPLAYGDPTLSLYGQTMPLFKPIVAEAGSPLEGASRSEKFLSAAFGLPPGAVSDPIVLGDNVVVIRVKEAGSALDDEIASISFYYSYLFQQKVDAEVRELFLQSPKLKDDFMNAYLKYFSPKQS